MYAQAVDVLQQEVYENPLPGCAPQIISSRLNVLVAACIQMGAGEGPRAGTLLPRQESVPAVEVPVHPWRQAQDLPVVEPDQQGDLGTVEEGVGFEPGQVDPNPADDESGVPLPIPATGLFGVYTKVEAAKIFAATKSGEEIGP